MVNSTLTPGATKAHASSSKQSTKPQRRTRAALAAVDGTKAKPEFQLTAAEMALAKRFFRAARSMSPKDASSALSSFAIAMEVVAENHPRHKAPSLRLIAGGAK